MLKYYTYYSIGGYKDMFLGDSSMQEDCTYYVPLLPVLRKKALQTGDTDTQKKVAELEKLSMIKTLSKESTFDLPQRAISLISHGAYKLIYTQAENNTYIISLRDIVGTAKDESGRSIPFLIMIVGDSKTDTALLNKIAAYWTSNLSTVSVKIASMFTYDSEKNGLCFHLKSFSQWLQEIGEKSTGFVDTITSRIEIIGTSNKMLVLPQNITASYARKELELNNDATTFININDIIPNDDKKRIMEILSDRNRRNMIPLGRQMCYIVGGALVLGFILGYFAGRQ